jgi:hypothetical protein
LGAGTTQRFVLLIVLFVTGSAYMLTDLFSPYTDPLTLQSGCQLAAGVDPNVNSTTNYLVMETPAYIACVEKYVGGWGYVWLPYLATALLLVMAILLYLLLPHWKARAGRVVPLERADPDGSLRAALTGLADRSGLSNPPRFVVDLAAHSADALVFGRFGRYTVRMDMPLVVAFGVDRPAFEATVLHEFAHIRNKDVDITYLTVAIWRLFLFGVLMPFAVREGWLIASGALSHTHPLYWSGHAPDLVRDLALSAFIVALVYLVMADILRSREIYADIDAVRQQADRTLWTRHIPVTPRDRGRSRAMRAVRSAVRTHPDWRMRVAALADPSALFTVHAQSMFLTGATAEVLGYFLSHTPGTGEYLARFSWLQSSGIWPTAALVTGVAGPAVWRSVVHSVRNNLPIPSGLRAGLWLGAGQLAGELFVSQSVTHEWILPFPEVLLLLLLVIVPTAVLWWTAGCAALWADLPHRRGRLAAAAFTLAATSLALARWYEWWQQIGTIYATGNILGTASAYATIYSNYTHTTTMDVITGLTTPVVTFVDRWNLLLTAALWLIPMIGLARRARQRPSPLGNGGLLRLCVPLRKLSVGGASGLLGGVAAAIGVLVITGRAHLWMHRGDQSPEQVMLIYAYWVFAILLASATGAALAASAATRGDVAPAMTAAGSAMSIGLAIFIAVNETDGCVQPLNRLYSNCTPATGADWEVLTFTLRPLLSMVGITSLIGALLIAGFIKLWNPLDSPTNATDDTEPQPARRIVRKTWTATATAGAMLVATCTAAYADASPNGALRSNSGEVLASVASTQTVSPQLQTQQVRAWAYFGGKKLLQQYAEKEQNIIDAAPGGHINRPAMRRTCTAMAAMARQAQKYFPPPDTQKSAWSTALANTITGARKCVNGLDQANSQVLLFGLRDVNAASTTIADISGQLVEESAQ